MNTTGRQGEASNTIIPTNHGTMFSEDSTQFVRACAITSFAICCFVFILGDRLDTDETIAYVEY
jgi:hypothetical protein